jgi:4-hydroxy-2-oxoheptanedioate aldolase
MTLGSPLVAEHLAHIGFDWLVVDTEHGPASIETATLCFMAIKTTETVPMARVAWNDPHLIKRVLDTGALGVVVPMVNSVEEAEQAVGAMKHPPEGFRSHGGGRFLYYGNDYEERANDEIVSVVMIEHIQGVERAKEILSVPGVDAGFIGPADLAASLDAKWGDEKSEEAIQRILEAGKAVGTPTGIQCQSAEELNQRAAEGFQYLSLLSDTWLLTGAARSALAELDLPS